MTKPLILSYNGPTVCPEEDIFLLVRGSLRLQPVCFLSFNLFNVISQMTSLAVTHSMHDKAPVVQKVDNTIGFPNNYLLDSNLFSG